MILHFFLFLKTYTLMLIRYIFSRAGNLLIGFLSKLLVFCEKLAKEQFAQKNERFAQLLIFSERPERFAHDRSFFVSDLSELLMVAHFW